MIDLEYSLIVRTRKESDFLDSFLRICPAIQVWDVP